MLPMLPQGWSSATPGEGGTFLGTMSPLFSLRPWPLTYLPAGVGSGRVEGRVWSTHREILLCGVHEKARLEDLLFYVYAIKIPNNKFNRARKRILIQLFLEERLAFVVLIHKGQRHLW